MSLWLPPEKPAKPDRVYGAMEIRDDDDRERCRGAITQLFRAMKLNRGGGIRLPGDESRNDRLALYEYVSKSLLGEVLEQEVNT